MDTGNKINLQFLGAAETVTGSCYLLKNNEKNYLVDCGMFQGIDVFNKNYEDFKFDPKKIDCVLLTHAHIDHCGLLPKLVKEGFRGEIYCTPPTAKILELILPDSAKVQQNNFKYRGVRALYDSTDALNTLSLIRTKNFNEPYFIGSNLKVTFHHASHILGAASIQLEINEKMLLFSGDLGRRNPRIISGYRNGSLNPSYIIMESLYGNKDHPPIEESIANLTNIINKTVDRDGNVIIPIFALHRLQEFLVFLQILKKENKIPNSVQIYSDNPLGNKILDLYTQNSRYFNQEFNDYKDPFGFDDYGMHYIKSNNQSRKLSKKRKSIILAGGGMAEGGRIINHLHSFLEDEKSSLVFVGFQAEGTLGRKLSESPKEISIDKKLHEVKIEIHQISGFSAHADRKELKWWFENNSSNLQNLFLVHAEIDQSSAFKELLNGSGYDNVTIPKLNETFEI